MLEPTVAPPLPAAVRAALDQLRDQLIAAPFDAPDAASLHQLGLEEAALATAVRRRELGLVCEHLLSL